MPGGQPATLDQLFLDPDFEVILLLSDLRVPSERNEMLLSPAAIVNRRSYQSEPARQR